MTDSQPLLRCCTCRHWEPLTGIDGHGRDIANKVGTCSSDKFKLGYCIDVSKFVGDEVEVEDDEGWGFHPGPMFGCVHWRHK